MRVLVAQIDNLLLELELLSELIEQVASLGHLLVKQALVECLLILVLPSSWLWCSLLANGTSLLTKRKPLIIRLQLIHITLDCEVAAEGGGGGDIARLPFRWRERVLIKVALRHRLLLVQL